MHMEHTIAKDAFSGLSGNNAVYNAICIAVCDDEQFMCDMIEEKIKEMLPDAVVCKFFSAQELLDSETQIDAPDCINGLQRNKGGSQHIG